MVDFGQSGKSNEISAHEPVAELSWRAGVQGGFEWLTLSKLRERKHDHELTVPQRPRFHVLLFYRGGAATHVVDFVSIDFPPNTLIHVSPNQVHAFESLGDVEADLLIFQDDILPPEFFQAGSLPALPEYFWPVAVTLDDGGTQRLGQLFALLQSFEADTGHGAQEPTARFLALAIASFGYQSAIAGDANYRHPGAHVAYYRFLALMEGHFRTMRGAQWYASELGCSYRTLCRVCQRATGRTPKELIDERIMKEARRLLGFSPDPVYGIAEELGFSESTNFVKFFVRHEGQTPDAFRRTWKASASGQ